MTINKRFPGYTYAVIGAVRCQIANVVGFLWRVLQKVAGTCGYSIEVNIQMASHTADYPEIGKARHYRDMKELMAKYQKLILENQMVLENLDMECREKINEDMAYALGYLDIYNHHLNAAKLKFLWKIACCLFLNYFQKQY